MQIAIIPIVYFCNLTLKFAIFNSIQLTIFQSQCLIYVTLVQPCDHESIDSPSIYFSPQCPKNVSSGSFIFL